MADTTAYLPQCQRCGVASLELYLASHMALCSMCVGALPTTGVRLRFAAVALPHLAFVEAARAAPVGPAPHSREDVADCLRLLRRAVTAFVSSLDENLDYGNAADLSLIKRDIDQALDRIDGYAEARR